MLERPDDWERQIRARAVGTGKMSEAGLAYLRFWKSYLDRFPQDAEIGFKPVETSNVRLGIDTEVLLNVSVFKATDRVGLFVRGRRGPGIKR